MPCRPVAMPSRSGGTSDNSALAFGTANSPWPMPISIRPSTSDIPAGITPSRDSTPSPTAVRAMPVTVSERGPTRSARRPASGAQNSAATGRIASHEPDWAALRPPVSSSTSGIRKPTLTLSNCPRKVSVTAPPSGPNNRSSGSMGRGEFACSTKNTVSSSAPPMPATSTNGSPRPCSGARVSASITPASPPAHSSGGMPSSATASTFGRSGGTRFCNRFQASSPSGRLTKKIQRHDACATTKPPRGGPIASPTPTMAPNAPSARPRSANGNACTSSAEPFADTSAAPTPWSTRSAIRAPTEGANPHSTEASVNNSSPLPYTARRPRASASRPDVSSKPVRVSE